MINSYKFFDQPVKNEIKTYGNIKKITTGQGDDYKTVCLLDYTYLVIQNYKMIAIDLSKQQAFSADPKAIQQTNFTGNRERAENTKMFFIIEELKDTSHKQLRKYCKRVL